MNQRIEVIPEGTTFVFHCDGEVNLPEAQLRALQTKEPELDAKGDFNGSIYEAKIVMDGNQIIIYLSRSSYLHKLYGRQKIDGVEINPLIRCNAPILIKLVNRCGSIIGYMIGFQKTNQINVPGGGMDDQHVKAENPLLENARCELLEEMGLDLEQAAKVRLGYYIHDNDMNHFLVVAEFRVPSNRFLRSIWLHWKFLGRNVDQIQVPSMKGLLNRLKNLLQRTNAEMRDFTIVRTPEDIDRLEQQYPDQEIWWALKDLIVQENAR